MNVKPSNPTVTTDYDNVEGKRIKRVRFEEHETPGTGLKVHGSKAGKLDQLPFILLPQPTQSTQFNREP